MSAPILRIPVSNVVPVGAGSLSTDGEAVILTTDSQQWAYSAEVEFEIPGIDCDPRIVAVHGDVETGVLGVGWLAQDGQDWTAVANLDRETSPLAYLRIPARTVGGKLVFRNCSENGAVARVRVRTIEVVETPGHAVLAAIDAEKRGDSAAAISHYKAALTIDPAHVEAIAGLGRLRFVPPPQPLLDEWKRQSPQPDFCQVIVEVRNPCNYRCFYCVVAGQNNHPVQPFDFNKIERYYNSVKSELIQTVLECGGGEPAVHPQFGELLRLCASYGIVTFPTNNSQNPRRWLPQGFGNKLQIHAALHPEANEKLHIFLDNAKFLLDAECNFSCLFIAHPTRLPKLPYFADIFKKQSIFFYVVPFIGEFNGRKYPHSYTQAEKEMLLQYSQRHYLSDIMVQISPHVNRIRNFRGIPCRAGLRRLQITADGSMKRCSFDRSAMDGPHDTATPCGVSSCGCGLFLEKADWEDTYFRAVSVELDSFASNLGYADFAAGISAEYMATYDALMAAYGKDEFPE